jgi:glycerol kinase
MSRWILALDQGTTSCRSVLFDRRGTPVAFSQREFTQHFPEPGWVEHDAQEIWATQCATIEEVLKQAQSSPKDIVAIGIANQRETCLLWERASGQPVARAIVWQDRRTTEACEALRARGHEPAVEQRTGLRLDPYFSATKLAWLLDHVPQARVRAQRGELAFGTIDSWLIYRLTAGREHLTDVTNASRTLLLDLDSATWSQSMLELFDIPRACLPRIVGSSLRAQEAPHAELGGRRIAITGIAGDQQAALFGQCCLASGSAKNTYGTGCFLLMNTGPAPTPSQHRLISTVAWQRAVRTYALEGSVFVAGAAVQWLRDGLGLIQSAAQIEPLAQLEPDSGGLHLVPAFTGLGAPYWDPKARGTMVGITRGTNRSHLARATLEAIAFQSCDVLQAMERDAHQRLTELRVDGGASANNLLLQFQADLLGVPVLRPTVTETTALGAAYLAGLGSGYWSDEAEIAANWRLDRRFEPERSRDWAEQRRSAWAHAVTCARLAAG